MNRILILLTALVIAAGCGRSDEHAHDEDQRGPHNGRLLQQDGFAVELAIYEAGIPPEYRVWFYEDDKPLPADAATVEVELQRLGGKRDRFTFRPEGDYLRGSGVVEEPHSFDVTVRAQREGKNVAGYGLSEHYRKIFDLTRLDQVIPLYTSEAIALASAEPFDLPERES